MSVRMMMQGRQPSSGGVMIVEDSFNRADGSLGTADSGETWTVVAGPFSISSNQAATAAADALAVIAAEADGDLTIDADVGASMVSSLVFRYSDASNFHYVYDWPDSASIALRKVEAGSDTQYASAARSATSGTITYRVVLNGTDIDLYRNGSLAISTTSSFNQSATSVGMRASNGAGQANRWDNLYMETL